ncbi:MAG: DUF4321 domain-containing protein, partial [Gemmatimonadetes bacterium]|nr:DUF4321 domain-containing protein [Gemmatimonadota bacterium]
SIAGAFGPISLDLVAIALTLGPLNLYVNIMSLVGIVGAAYLYRSFF